MEREPDQQTVLDLGLPIPAQRGHAPIEETDDVLDSDLPERVVPAQRIGLDERSEKILLFERQWWKHAGAKEQAIRETFEISSTRYYQLLNKLLDDPRALEFDPALVNRLRRLRMSRARSRA